LKLRKGPTRATVKRRVTNYDGNLIGRAHKNLLLHTQMYELEYDNGKVHRFMANAAAKNIYSQMDSEGRQSVIIREIIGHQKDQTALTQQDIVDNGTLKRTTKGWWFLVECNDGWSEWVSLKDLNDGNPVELQIM
jgi:hypothetical protein